MSDKVKKGLNSIGEGFDELFNKVGTLSAIDARISGTEKSIKDIKEALFGPAPIGPDPNKPKPVPDPNAKIGLKGNIDKLQTTLDKIEKHLSEQAAYKK